MNNLRSLVSPVLLLLFSCSIPDLNDENILVDAKREAIELSTLTKEFMYGMMWLYVDDKNETFTGWVKETHANQNIKSLGYLKKGQKQGLWISWHENGNLKSKFGWKNDYYHGVFKFWYPNKNLGVTGQTKEGEVDGEWKQFYLNGNKHFQSKNRVGKLISIKVWKVDGELCPESHVENGRGQFVEYKENGEPLKIRIVKDGVEID